MGINQHAQLVGVLSLSAQIGYIVPWAYEIYIECRARGKTHSNINRQNDKQIHTNVLFSLGFVEIILPRIGILRGFFLANHLASTDNKTKTTNTINQSKHICKVPW